jgi:hypothetical protein
MAEKIEEINTRVRLLSNDPINIENYVNDISSGKNDKYKIEQFTPIYAVGKIADLNNVYKIINTVDNEPGYRIIIPMFLKIKNNFQNKKHVVFVDFGWIPNSVDINMKLNFILNKDLLISGIVYLGDNKVGNKNKNDLSNEKMISLHLDELIHLNKNQNLTDINYMDFIIKRVNLDNTKNLVSLLELNNKNILNVNELEYPKIKNKEEMLTWYIMPKTHKAYYTFWMTSTILNIFSNFYVWIYL